MIATLFDDPELKPHLYPFSAARPIADIRLGGLTLLEKWQSDMPDLEWQHATSTLLQPLYPKKSEDSKLWISGALLPDYEIVKAISELPPAHTLTTPEGEILAWHHEGDGQHPWEAGQSPAQTRTYSRPVQRFTRIWQVFELLHQEIKRDIQRVGARPQALPASAGVTIIGDPKLVFMAPGAKALACTLNTSAGPIFLDEDSEIMEGVNVRGPLFLGKHSTLKMGAKVYGAVATGPEVKLGGEVSQVQVQGYSNKGHDGFLGHSMLGEWCNLGADTNNSNLKNNYAPVKLWNAAMGRFEATGLTFCGLFMGDHSKCGINTMFNTGTVVGFSANIFGSGFPRNWIPDFSWGGAAGFSKYKLDAAIETATRMMERRGLSFDDRHRRVFQSLFEESVSN